MSMTDVKYLTELPSEFVRPQLVLEPAAAAPQVAYLSALPAGWERPILELPSGSTGKYPNIESDILKVREYPIYHPSFIDNSPITSNVGLELFDKSIVSQDLPLIQYRQYRKIHVSLNVYDTGSQQVTLPVGSAPDKLVSPDVLYLFVKLEKTTGLTKLEYNLHNNELPMSRKELIPIIERTLPIRLGSSISVYYGGSINLFSRFGPLILIKPFFLNVLLDPPYIDDFYFEESDKPVYFKQHFELHYAPEQKGVGTATISIVPLSSSTSTNSIVVKPSGTPYFAVKIHHVISRKALDTIVDDLCNLVNAYAGSRTPSIPALANFLSDSDIAKLQEISQPPEPKQRKGRSGYSSGSLAKQFPDIFREGYAKMCPARSEPTAYSVDSKEIDFYRSQEKTLKFPIPNPRMELVCLNEDQQFIKLKRNTNKENNEQYPFLPCCAHREDPLVREYIDSKGNIREAAQIKGTKAVITPAKGAGVLMASAFGRLPIRVDGLLQIADPNMKWWRMGVPITGNSLLHCMLLAVDDPEYLKIKGSTAGSGGKESVRNEAALEQYVIRVRNNIANKTYPGLFRQELFNTSESTIAQMLRSADFYDPRLFYRGIEEYFNVSLFVFGVSSGDQRYRTIDEGIIDLPDFRIPLARPPRTSPRGSGQDCKSVLIFRTLGSIANDLKYPQCELIVASNKTYGESPEHDQALMKMFGARVCELYYNTVSKLFGVITWNVSNINYNINSYEGIYNADNYFTLFAGMAKYQYIDKYGKLRALMVSTTDGQREQLMTVMFPPSQPVNLPTYQTNTSTGSVGLPTINYTILIRLDGPFSNPSSLVHDSKGDIIGVWYTIHQTYQFGICVPIISTSLQMLPPAWRQLPRGDPLPIITTSSQLIFTAESRSSTGIIDSKNAMPVGKFTYMKNNLTTLISILEYLYSLDPSDPKVFMSRYLRVDTRASGAAGFDFYSFHNIAPYWPRNIPISEAMSRLSKVNPQVFLNGQITVISQDLANKLQFQLLNIAKRYSIAKATGATPTTEVFELAGVYVLPENFTQQSDAIIQTNDSAYSTWLQNRSNPYGSIGTRNGRRIHMIITNKMADLIEPLIVLYGTNTTSELIPAASAQPIVPQASLKVQPFLLQNISAEDGKGYLRAITVARKWQTDHVNLGYSALPFEGDLAAVAGRIDYNRNANGLLIRVSGTESSSGNISILDYKTVGKFAALLPL
jgi:hypothetical protein